MQSAEDLANREGVVPVRATDVKILCQLYETTADMTAGLIALARETKAKGWWHAYGDAVPGWFELYVGLEGAATRVRKYEPALIPGLLQAHAYMESVIRADRPDLDDADVQRRMAVKMERQGLLSRHFPPPPQLEVIICEGALRRAPAVPGAMAQQLWHLLKANERPHVSVRALPLRAGPHRASVSGAFTILDFPPDDAGRQEPSTIYSESLTGALYLDKPGEIETYDAVWADLAEKALDSHETDKVVTTLIEEMNNRE